MLADTILKKYSSTVATIFTGIASAALFGHALTINFILGISIVFISMHQVNMREREREREREGGRVSILSYELVLCIMPLYSSFHHSQRLRTNHRMLILKWSTIRTTKGVCLSTLILFISYICKLVHVFGGSHPLASFYIFLWMCSRAC